MCRSFPARRVVTVRGVLGEVGAARIQPARPFDLRNGDHIDCSQACELSTFYGFNSNGTTFVGLLRRSWPHAALILSPLRSRIRTLMPACSKTSRKARVHDGCGVR